MHLKTILNRICKFKRFVYGNCYFNDAEELIIELSPRKNSQAICSNCKASAPVYDHLTARKFEFIPIFNIRFFFLYIMRRVSCPECGIKVEYIPWASGKSHMTNVFQVFLANWAEDLPWKRVSERFRISWQSVYRSVDKVVKYGLKYRDLSGVVSIGVDEITYRKQIKDKFLTVVYQLDKGSRRLLWVGQNRTSSSFRKFFVEMEEKCPEFKSGIKFACSDMWRAYLKVIREEIPNAMHVLDRFHIRKKFSEAIDTTRRQEVKRLKEKGCDPVLTKSRWCFLKKRQSLTGKHKSKLKELLSMNLRTVKVYLLTEEFEHFWTYNSTTWAKKFLKQWTRKVMYSKIEPIKEVAKMLRRHEELILNWFRAKKEISNGITEGLNNNAKVAFRNARGYRTFNVAEIALYHQMGKLPKPKFKHHFF